MEVGMEMEDDLFFADLSKQISLLIMDDDDDDDDDDDHVPVVPWQYSSSLQGFSRISAIPPPCMYEELACRSRETSCKGTGVFIPKLSQPPRRKNRPSSGGGGGRRFTSAPRSHKHNNNDHYQNNIYRSASGAPQNYFTKKSFQPQEIQKGPAHLLEELINN